MWVCVYLCKMHWDKHAKLQRYLLIALKHFKKILCFKFQRKIIDLYNVRELFFSKVDIIFIISWVHIKIIKSWLLN